MENSNIEWTDHTWNPWIGCTKVSPGCLNCYAEHLMDTRMGRVQWGRGGARQRTSKAYWKKLLTWNQEAAVTGKRPKVFVASLADWLDEEVEIEWLADLLDYFRQVENLQILALTKRPHLWRSRVEAAERFAIAAGRSELTIYLRAWLSGHRPPNLWIGTSVEDQTRADERIPALLSIPAPIHFLSCEPLLGEIDIRRHLLSDYDKAAYAPQLIEPLGGFTLVKVDWLICGGESGPQARRMTKAWARSLRDQCVEYGCAFFFKQWGGKNKKAAGRLLDGRNHDAMPDAA